MSNLFFLWCLVVVAIPWCAATLDQLQTGQVTASNADEAKQNAKTIFAEAILTLPFYENVPPEGIPLPKTGCTITSISCSIPVAEKLMASYVSNVASLQVTQSNSIAQLFTFSISELLLLSCSIDIRIPPPVNTTAPATNATFPGNSTAIPTNNTTNVITAPADTNNTTTNTNTNTNATNATNTNTVPTNAPTFPTNTTTIPNVTTTIATNTSTVPTNAPTFPTNTTIPTDTTTIPTVTTTINTNPTTVNEECSCDTECSCDNYSGIRDNIICKINKRFGKIKKMFNYCC